MATRREADEVVNPGTVSALDELGRQHDELRRLFREGQQRPWSDWNVDAVAEWLARPNRNGR